MTDLSPTSRRASALSWFRFFEPASEGEHGLGRPIWPALAARIVAPALVVLLLMAVACAIAMIAFGRIDRHALAWLETAGGPAAERPLRTDVTQLLEVTQDARVLVAAALVLAVLAAGLLAYLMAREASRPLESLKRAMIELAAGRTPQITGITARADEIGAMARALEVFERMARELETSRVRLSEAIEMMPAGIAVYDAEDRLVLANRRFRELYEGVTDRPGLEPLAGAEGAGAEPMSAGGASGSLPAGNAIAAALRRARSAGGTRESRLGHLWIRVVERPTSNGGTIGVHLDVTEAKLQEQRLRAALTTAEAANAAKMAFLAQMSHELRTPLNAILGFAEMMRLEAFGPVGGDRYREYLKDIHDSGAHLLELITDILEFSKVEAGQLRLSEEPVVVDALIESCSRLMSERAQGAGLTLALEVPKGLPRIQVDRLRLKQVLINLLSNAIKFTPRGGRITIAAGLLVDGSLEIAVRDSGIGISSENLSRVLEPFQQVENYLSRQHGGTGLGLPLAKTLIEMHDGRLAVRSRVGEGTVVTIRLPPERVLPDPT